MSRIEELVRKEFASQPFTLEDIIKYLEENDTIRWAIFRQQEKQYHREDLEYKLDEINEENGTTITFTDDEWNAMVERFEDRLADSDEWTYIRDSILNEWVEDYE